MSENCRGFFVLLMVVLSVHELGHSHLTCARCHLSKGEVTELQTCSSPGLYFPMAGTQPHFQVRNKARARSLSSVGLALGLKQISASWPCTKQPWGRQEEGDAPLDGKHLLGKSFARASPMGCARALRWERDKALPVAAVPRSCSH